MSAYLSAVDDLCAKKSAALERDLFWDEVLKTQDEVLDQWIRAERFDDLIEHALDEFDVQDGEVFCAVLGNALCKKNDRARIERLFLGLARTREAAFWRNWGLAQEGKIGAMKDAAKRLTSTLESLGELWHCYWVLGDTAAQVHTKAEMLRVQSREKKSKAPVRRQV